MNPQVFCIPVLLRNAGTIGAPQVRFEDEASVIAGSHVLLAINFACVKHAPFTHRMLSPPDGARWLSGLSPSTLRRTTRR